MTQNPDEIREEIERTRSELSQDIDALSENVSPLKVVHRQTEKVRDTMTGWKDKVMGTANDATSRVSEGAEHLADSSHQVPQQTEEKTRRNPLAAGLIALDSAWLMASLLPASEAERKAAAKLGGLLSPPGLRWRTRPAAVRDAAVPRAEPGRPRWHQFRRAAQCGWGRPGGLRSTQ